MVTSPTDHEEYELVVDDGNMETRKTFLTRQSAKDAWASAMLMRKSIFSATLIRLSDQIIDDHWERA